MRMQFEAFSFGSIPIDGITYEHDVVIDRCHRPWTAFAEPETLPICWDIAPHSYSGEASNDSIGLEAEFLYHWMKGCYRQESCVDVAEPAVPFFCRR
jgi:hypothetical protein